MEQTKWIKNIVFELLSERLDILDQWRNQDLTTSERVKNFENWLLVELVYRLRKAGIKDIKTNGYFRERPSYYKRDHAKEALRGVKSKSHSISPDLTFKLPDGNGILQAEIKTQTSPQSIIDDIRLVKFHNDHELNPNYRAFFLWVIAAPNSDKFITRVRRSNAKIKDKLASEGIDIEVMDFPNTNWLYYCIATPGCKMNCYPEGENKQ
jgi:hypothetical protein